MPNCCRELCMVSTGTTGTKWSARRLSDPSRMVISDAYPRMSLPTSVASTNALDPT